MLGYVSGLPWYVSQIVPQISANVLAVDTDHDLAVLSPSIALTANSLTISTAQHIAIGAHVSTWGFPGGYSGAAPMLSAGYLAAKDARKTASGKVIEQWVVNAAFNSGNSGGPLLLIETGEVVGVVSSKLAPISTLAANCLDVLSNNRTGVAYTYTKSDGNTETIIESQIVAMILNELRKQVQLVIGYAVLPGDIRTFLSTNGIEP